MKRELERELLDDLPADDPRAVHSRRDLQRANAWMGHVRIMGRVLAGAFRDRAPTSIVELGAGDGTLLLRLANKLGPRWTPSRVVLLDQQRLLSPETGAGFTALSWNVEAVQMDVFDWLERREAAPCDLTIANLFLHHFNEGDLRRLFRYTANQTGFFLACEPRRSRATLGATALLRLIGCNDVSTHDAKISVRAGFTDHELSSLWPRDSVWRLMERRAGWVSQCFVAQRRVTSISAAAAPH